MLHTILRVGSEDQIIEKYTYDQDSLVRGILAQIQLLGPDDSLEIYQEHDEDLNIEFDPTLLD